MIQTSFRSRCYRQASARRNQLLFYPASETTDGPVSHEAPLSYTLGSAFPRTLDQVHNQLREPAEAAVPPDAVTTCLDTQPQTPFRHSSKGRMIKEEGRGRRHPWRGVRMRQLHLSWATRPCNYEEDSPPAKVSSAASWDVYSHDARPLLDVVAPSRDSDFVQDVDILTEYLSDFESTFIFTCLANVCRIFVCA